MFVHSEKVLQAAASGFGGKPILVIGDVMLDRHIWGEVKRISPEAPVPVVRVTRQTQTAGGAGNVALNLAALGVTTLLAGVTGADPERAQLLELLEKTGVQTQAVVSAAGRPTITKTRVIGAHQQMLRMDMEDVSAFPAAVREKLERAVLERLDAGLGAVVLSDYGKGVAAAALCQAVIARGRKLNIPVLVDPKGRDFAKYAGATLVSPNRLELAEATGAPFEDLDALLAAGEALRRRLDLKFIAATLSERGIVSLSEQGRRSFPAVAREVFDVSGAGDTAIATVAAGMAAGLDPEDTFHLANVAAGIVVGKVGTVPVHREELLDAIQAEEFQTQSAKILSLESAAQRAAKWRARGERVVFTNGCFDLLHVGHVAYLEAARRLGQHLIVGLNTDASVRRLKGPARPLIPQDQRARVLAALASVDGVVLFDEDTPLALIQALRPDVLCKGGDYNEKTTVGAKEVRAWGGDVQLIPLVEGWSTTGIVAKAQKT